MYAFYSVAVVLAIVILARIVGALVVTSDPNALWRHKVRLAAARIGWCLALVTAGCSTSAPVVAPCPILRETCGDGPACGTDISASPNCGGCGVVCSATQMCGVGCGETVGCYDVGGGTGPNDCPSCYPSDAGVCPSSHPVSLRCDPGAAIPGGCMALASGGLGACCPTADGGQ